MLTNQLIFIIIRVNNLLQNNSSIILCEVAVEMRVIAIRANAARHRVNQLRRRPAALTQSHSLVLPLAARYDMLL